MPRPAPPAHDPVTLFYPVNSEQLAPASSGVFLFLFIPFLLLLALLAPAILLYIPVVLIEHWLTKRPLTFDLQENAIPLSQANHEKH